ncbi:MAG: hypothetical protein LAP87_10060 [Acidobacteriia bacterium]|nr:hypothetical protein [Terriglobia bacterium]
MDLAAAAARLRKFEGSVPHMYRCTGGEVTAAAVDAGDWNTAAAQRHGQGIGEPRNQETAALFLQAGS